MPATDAEQESRRDNWHNSSTDTILGCPRRYALEYEVGLVVPTGTASAVGTAVHAGLEAHEVARAAGEELSQEQVLAVALASLASERERLAPAQAADEALAAEMQADVAAAIGNWWSGPMEAEGWVGSARDYVLTLTPVASETYLHAAVLAGTSPLAGTLDGVYRDNLGRLVMLDWKTTAKLDGWRRGGDDKRHQATFYAAMLALSGDYPELEALPPMHYVVVRRTKVRKGSPASILVVVEPDMKDLAELGQRVREAEAIKQAGVYPANPQWKWCSFSCPFKPLCVPGTGELLAPLGELAGYAGTAWMDRLPVEEQAA